MGHFCINRERERENCFMFEDCNKTILQGYDDLCQSGQYSPCSCESVIRVTVGTGGGGGLWALSIVIFTISLLTDTDQSRAIMTFGEIFTTILPFSVLQYKTMQCHSHSQCQEWGGGREVIRISKNFYQVKISETNPMSAWSWESVNCFCVLVLKLNISFCNKVTI